MSQGMLPPSRPAGHGQRASWLTACRVARLLGASAWSGVSFNAARKAVKAALVGAKICRLRGRGHGRM